jgi:hypothetical protein
MEVPPVCFSVQTIFYTPGLPFSIVRKILYVICIDPKTPKSDWQTAFGELFLSLDGLTILGDVANKHIINDDTTRVVFGLYAEDLNIPLSTPFGEFILSPIEKLPNRLNSIAMNINLD